MASVVGIRFVDESQNFDFENSGKSSRPRRETCAKLYIADSDEIDVESKESGDASPSEEDVEISSFESEDSESANSSESFLLLTKTTRDEDMGSVKLNPPNVTKNLVGRFIPQDGNRKLSGANNCYARSL